MPGVAACVSLGDDVAVAFAEGRSVRFWRTGGAAAELGSADSAITIIALDSSAAHVATANDKALTLWDVAARRALWRTVAPKRPNAMVFDGARLIFADKFGEVWSLAEAAASDSTRAADNAVRIGPEPCFELGHVSLVSAMAVLPGRERRLVTADTDKRIRVSAWPAGYCIDAFCMGSKAVPSALAFAHGPLGEVLLSGGEDGALHAWDPATGALLALVHPAADLPAPEPSAAAPPSPAPRAVRVVCAGLGAQCALLALALAESSRVAIYALERDEDTRLSLRAHAPLDLPGEPGAVLELHATPRGDLCVVCAGGLLLQYESTTDAHFRLAAQHALCRRSDE
ncbi:hypothetical protein KFE25_012478 [Diacronema lutheri]|uniref:tRNA (guanine-N(7)-)-methyltransferase non-catalytic subunit n=2 Tax=Diacronema lutheri TaxID=2081491 RepID=A0A8J5XTF4_DIALT|nr:hypothetical protein KFE25_012478 [Diacronema lutheri]